MTSLVKTRASTQLLANHRVTLGRLPIVTCTKSAVTISWTYWNFIQNLPNPSLPI